MEAKQESEKLSFTSFTSDAKSLLTCSNERLCVYSLTNENSPKLVHKIQGKGAIILAERHVSTSLLLFVHAFEPCCLKMHFMKNSSTSVLKTYDSRILSIKLNRTSIVVVTKEEIHVHALITMNTLHVIKNKGLISNWFCELSVQAHQKANSLLAHPNSEIKGSIEVVSTKHFETIASFPAHGSEIAILKFNPEGTLLASASEKGTVVRIFLMPNGELLHKLRRGMFKVQVQSLAFNSDSSFLACVSTKKTVHIFKLTLAHAMIAEETGSSDYFAQSFVSGSLHLLHSTLSETFVQDRAYAKAKLPTANHQSTATWTKSCSSLIVVSEDGFLRKFAAFKAAGEWPLCSEIYLTDEDMGDQDKKCRMSYADACKKEFVEDA